MSYKGRSYWFYGKRLFRKVGEDDVGGAASELAYKFFLAVFPFFIFLAALGGFAADVFGVQNPTERVMDWLGDSLPSDASGVLRGQLQTVIEQRNPTLLSLGIVGAVWAAASGVGTVMKSLNKVYEVRETRPIWARYAMALGLTLFGGAFLVTAFAVLVVGQVQGLVIARELGMGSVASHAFTLARWPLVIGLIMAAMAFVYWATPNVDLPFKWITPGAVVFTIAWLVASYAFAVYVANFGAYNATYGTLGGIVILLFWFYLTAFAMLLGGEINALLAQEVAPEELPQTRADGATPETVPPHRKAEAASKSGRPPLERAPAATVSERRLPGAAASRDGRPSRLVALAGLMVAALTFWRFARPNAGRA